MNTYKISRFFGAFLIACFITLPLLNVEAKPSGQQEGVGVNTNTPSGITLEIDTPNTDLEIKPVNINGQQFVTIDLPSWAKTSQPGEPSLPFLAKAYGVPASAKISLEVIPGKAQTIALPARVMPAPTQELNWEKSGSSSGQFDLPLSNLSLSPDPNVYSIKSSYPGSLSRVIQDGFIRQQRVISVGFYPIQYLPLSNQLVIYDHLQVKIQFEGELNPDSMQTYPDSAVYENWFRTNLENYESAKNWRISQAKLAEIEIIEQGIEAFSETGSGWIPPNPGWRIKIKDDGIYRLTYSELESAEFPVGTVNPAKIQMFNQGMEIAISVIGDGDTDFEPGEELLFYGQAFQNKYTQYNIYWLTFSTEDGLRINTRSSPPASGEVPVSFNSTKTHEINNAYLTAIPGDKETERFIWGAIYASTSNIPTSWSTTFFLKSPVTEAVANISVTLIGWLEVTTNPDHHAQVYLNEVYLGDAWWDGITTQVLNLEIPGDVLLPGNNILKITLPNDTGYGKDFVFIDHFEITYQAAFQAENDSLHFTQESPGTKQFQVSGFESNQLAVYDISDPAALVQVLDFSLSGEAAPYSLAFEETLASPSTYWTGALSTYQPVLEITKDNPSGLKSGLNSAEYLLISYEDFISAGQTLVDHRQAQNMESLLVDVQDIYDEFNYGIVDAESIHDFLAYTYASWQPPAPSFVVLLGDGNHDPKNYLNYGRTSFIPPYLDLVDPWIKETASDNRYVTLVGDDQFPDMMIGRLSVEDLPGAIGFVEKIISYEQSPTADWQEKVLAVADDADSGGNFPWLSNLIMDNHLPDSYQVEKIYLGDTYTDPTLAREAVKTGITTGKFLINYIGHGQYTGWGYPVLLETTDIDLLENAGMYPVVLAMTCYDGFFHRPGTSSGDYRSMAEVFTRAEDKGAVASWSPSGLGVASGHSYLNSGFYDAVFADGAGTVGEAILAGKLNLWETGSNLDLVDTYHLFGDPATRFARKFTAIDDAYQSNEDQVLTESAPGVLINDKGPETMTASLVSGPEFGSLELSQDGSFSYTPNANFYGTDSFTYQASDGTELSNIATVTITVNPVNDPPVAVDDSFMIDQDTSLDIVASALTANDTDVDSSLLSVTALSNPLNGTVNLASGEVTFSPTPGFYGTAGFDYTLSDGDLTDSGHVTVIVNQVISNHPPVAVNDSYSVNEDSVLNISAPGVLSNDTDDDGDTLTTVLQTGPIHGSFTLNGNGSFTYTPAANYSGSDSFTYKADDGKALSNLATVSLTITPVNDPPLVSGIPDQTISEGSTFTTINLDTYVTDPDNANLDLTWSYSGNSDLTVIIEDRLATINIPNLDWNGSETITFTATDPGGLSDQDSATFTVSAVNDAPVNSLPDPQTTLLNTALVFSTSNLVSVSDVDVAETAGGQLRVSLSVIHGLLSVSQVSGLTFSLGDGTEDASMVFSGTVADINAALDGMLYRPNPGYVGSEKLTINTNDQGYTGDGEILSATDYLDIVVIMEVYLPIIIR